MKLVLILILVCLLFAVSTSCSTIPENPNTNKPVKKENTFPTVTGKNLSGELFTFPEDLKHEYNLLAVAFLREQQSDVDTWIPKMEDIEKTNSNFKFYEIPTIRKMDVFSKWFIYQGMRGGIPSEKARERTVTLHIDKEPFKDALEIDTEQQIYLLLVDNKGEIIWRASQLWTENKQADILKLLIK